MKLELRSITKRFGPLVANDHIDLDVEPGQIHCLLGENGAGKSTLMNILYGLYTADEGEILIDGERQQFDGPGDAMAAGIGMVHQHFMLVPVFTVAENVMLGHEPTHPGGRLDMAQARELVKIHSARLGFELDPDALVEDLPVGVQQRVEIVKALSRDAKVLVFDEPTAVLTPQETDELIEIMRELRDQGTAIVFISHKLREVRAVADTITIIRHGAVVGNAPPETSPEELANLMVGRPVNLKVSKGESNPGDVALEVHDLTVLDSRGQRVVDQISFDIRSGEVLAVAGVQGNGQTELVEAIMGLRPAAGGQVLVHGQDVSESTVRDIIQAGVGYIPEDRHRDAIVAELSISENIFLNRSFSPTLVKHASIRAEALRELTDGLIQQYDVRTPHSRVPIGKLSGGNQQKVVIARELDRDLTLFVASQPTRGIDVGSIEFVHNQIVAARDAGVGVLVVSTELDEVTALADRIMVMFHGRVMGIVPATTSREQLGLLMAGIEQSKQEDVA